MEYRVIQDMRLAIQVMGEASHWLTDNDKPVSKWWKLETLKPEILLDYAKPDEFFVLLANDVPACAAILQVDQNAQDWKTLEKGNEKAIYVHWLCVGYNFHGQELPEKMIDFASLLSQKLGATSLRADTNASEVKLRSIYERLGFHLRSVLKEDYRQTALYERPLDPTN